MGGVPHNLWRNLVTPRRKVLKNQDFQRQTGSATWLAEPPFLCLRGGTSAGIVTLV
jgi:hypothetical protein